MSESPKAKRTRRKQCLIVENHFNAGWSSCSAEIFDDLRGAEKWVGEHGKPDATYRVIDVKGTYKIESVNKAVKS